LDRDILRDPVVAAKLLDTKRLPRITASSKIFDIFAFIEYSIWD
jgi:hypothetical protein